MSSVQVLTRALIALVVVTILGFAMFSFQVASNESAVLTRFGSPVRTLADPGLYFKWPWPVDTVHRFDTRLAFYDTRVSEALTQDKRNVILPVFLAWRVADPLKFLQALGTPAAVPTKLDSLAISARNSLLGRYDFQELVSTDPARLKLAELEQRLTEEIRPAALAAFGIAIEQVGLKRIALPEANTLYVFERMKAERGQYAAKFRAEGRREAEELRAKTDAERTVLIAEAQKFAEETRGKGEAEAARIYAEAHAQDPKFYQFLRELETLRKVTRENTTLILDTDTAPFNQLKAVPAK
ncbi:protease modulator HflC [Sphingomonas sp.]|uniref:protease modulator HflC n=1 Tax=Sphingomonas sp. TaxID=28214 RepID=UPI002DD64AAE|nr:protease modulator HflC [Sphingomonas sp.]